MSCQPEQECLAFLAFLAAQYQYVSVADPDTKVMWSPELCTFYHHHLGCFDLFCVVTEYFAGFYDHRNQCKTSCTGSHLAAGYMCIVLLKGCLSIRLCTMVPLKTFASNHDLLGFGRVSCSAKIITRTIHQAWIQWDAWNIVPATAQKIQWDHGMQSCSTMWEAGAPQTIVWKLRGASQGSTIAVISESWNAQNCCGDCGSHRS